MKTYNEIVDNLESLEKKEANHETRLKALESQGTVRTYLHCCRITTGNGLDIVFNLYSTTGTPFTKDTLLSFFGTRTGYIVINGGDSSNPNDVPVFFEYVSDKFWLRVRTTNGSVVSGREFSKDQFLGAIYIFTDTVI